MLSFKQTLLAMLFIATSFFHCHAVGISDNGLSDPLSKHIETYCRKDCVDPGLLRIALQEAAERTKVDPLLMAAVIHVESRFQQQALNTVNGRSVGLTQVQVRWHRERFISKNQFDVFDNVYAGSEILRDCITKHQGNTRKALWCYNGHGKKGMTEYVPKVLAVYVGLKQQHIVI